MTTDYNKQLSVIFPIEKDGFKALSDKIIFKEIPAGTILLSEGEIAAKLYIVLYGCLRAYFIKENGTEITIQFFPDGQIVSSFESAMTGTPSRLYIESIENSVIGWIGMKTLSGIIEQNNSLRDFFNRLLMKRLISYMNLHSSFILDRPEKRYINFVKENPDLESRIQKQYIASYLGITPVSLSRIRSKLKKRINNC